MLDAPARHRGGDRDQRHRRSAARLDVRVDQYNVSPKLAHSGNPAELALKPEMLDRWATDARAFFKFVIAAPDDVDEVLRTRRERT